MMMTRITSLVVCLTLASCSDVESTQDSTESKAVRKITRPANRSQQGLTVERVKNLLKSIDPRLQFVRQDMRSPGLPKSPIFYGEFETEGVKVLVNIGFRDGEDTEFTYLKIVLNTQGESRSSIPDSFIKKYIASFVHKGLDDGDAIWTNLLDQPNFFDNALEKSNKQILETESSWLMLARKGNVSDSQFEEIEFEFMTPKYREEIDSRIPQSMRNKKPE